MQPSSSVLHLSLHKEGMRVCVEGLMTSKLTAGSCRQSSCNLQLLDVQTLCHVRVPLVGLTLALSLGPQTGLQNNLARPAAVNPHVLAQITLNGSHQHYKTVSPAVTAKQSGDDLEWLCLSCWLLRWAAVRCPDRVPERIGTLWSLWGYSCLPHSSQSVSKAACLSGNKPQPNLAHKLSKVFLSCMLAKPCLCMPVNSCFRPSKSGTSLS